MLLRRVLRTLSSESFHNQIHFRRKVTFSEILPSIRTKVIDILLVQSSLCFAIYPRTFLHSGVFRDNEMNWLRKRDPGIDKKCYQVEIGSLP